MSLALFGFDELEAKLYYLSTGKHINENLLSPPRGNNESSSSSIIMDEESISNCDAQMEEDAENTNDDKATASAVSDSHVRMTEDISDGDSLGVESDVEDMEVTQEPKLEGNTKSPEKHVRFELASKTEDQMADENIEDEVAMDRGSSPKLQTETSSHLDSDVSSTKADANAESVCPPAGVSDDVSSVPETSCLASQDGCNAEKKIDTTLHSDTIAEKITNPATSSTEQVSVTKHVSSDEEVTPVENLNPPRSPIPVEPTNTEVDPSSHSTNLTSRPDDDASNNNMLLNESLLHNGQANDVFEQIQPSCKQCYVKLYKMRETPMIEPPQDLLKSCKNCYVRLNKLHVNDLLLSCRQCSVVVPKLALQVHN